MLGRQAANRKNWWRSPVWLSILIHLLLLLLLCLSLFKQPEQPVQKQDYVPAYVYNEPKQKQQQVKTEYQQRTVRKQQTAETKKPEKEEVHLKDKVKLQATVEEKLMPEVKSNIAASEKPQKPQSILSSSFKVLEQKQMDAIVADQDEEPIYLIGGPNGISDPFITLIAKALSAHFEYPKTAGELGAQGVVMVKMTLHPDGYFFNVTIVNSSHVDALDTAALYAVNSAPKINGADRFISKPKTFVVGFLFRQFSY